jgi:hypothetical protein
MQDQHDRFAAAMSPANIEGLAPDQALQLVGEQFIHALLDRESLAFFRLVVGEGRKFPQLMQRYNSAGADRIRAQMAKHLKQAGIDDAETAAGYFFELLRSNYHYRALADQTYVVSDPELKQHVAKTVRFLLKGMGVRP